MMKDYTATMWRWIANALADPSDQDLYRHDWFITEVTVLEDWVDKERKAIMAFNLMMNHNAGKVEPIEYKGSWIEELALQLMDTTPNLRIAFEVWIYG